LQQREKGTAGSGDTGEERTTWPATKGWISERWIGADQETGSSAARAVEREGTGEDEGGRRDHLPSQREEEGFAAGSGGRWSGLGTAGSSAARDGEDGVRTIEVEETEGKPGSR